MINCKPLTLFLLTIRVVDAQFDVVIKNPSPSLANGYCVAHPHALRLKAEKKSVKEVQSDAFSKCTSLTTILLNTNQISRLDENLFKYNTNLEVLQLGDNLIENIDDVVFSALGNLRILGLASNRLRYFSAVAVKNCINLQNLYLQGNELLDIDERSLLGYLPTLKSLGINNNDLVCRRVEQILAALKAIGVTKETGPGKQRTRNYAIKKIEGIDCIDGLNGRIIESIGNIQQQFNTHYLSKSDTINTEFLNLRSQLLNTTDSSKNEIRLLADTFQRTVKMTMQQLNDVVNEIKTDVASLKAVNAEFQKEIQTVKEFEKKVVEIQRILQLELDDIKLTTKRRVLALSNFCNSV